MLFYNRQGRPIGAVEASALMENLDYKRVKLTLSGDEAISTVWLGIPHGEDAYGVPIIFETMYFKNWSSGHLEESYCERYCTEEEAALGHDRIVRRFFPSLKTDSAGNPIIIEDYDELERFTLLIEQQQEVE